MRNKLVVIILIVLVVAGAWFGVIKVQTSRAKKIEQISSQIEQNIELKTYKNNIELYKELLTIDKDNIKWYVDYAESYYNVEQYGNYTEVCELMVKKFPDDTTGYKMLMGYYSSILEHKKVISTYASVPESLKDNDEIKAIYKENEWKFVYLARSYENIDTYCEDYTLVNSKNIYGYVNSSATEIIKCKFEKARPMIEDCAAVFLYNEWYFIDKEGDRVIASKDYIDDLYSFSENYAVAKIDGKYGYVDKNFGKHSFEYDMATNFYNGVAAVKKSEKWALINSEFEEITEFKYDDIIIDSANLCSRKGIVFAKEDDKYIMLNKSGETVSDLKFNNACLFYDDLAAVEIDGKWGFVNKSGEMVIDCKYDEAKSFNCGIAPVKLIDKWGYINTDSEVVVELAYNDAKVVSNSGIAIIEVGNYYRFIQFYKYR